MIYSALKLAEYLDGKLQGNPDVKVTNMLKYKRQTKILLHFFQIKNTLNMFITLKLQ